MMSAIDDLRAAVDRDDPAAVRRLLDESPGLKRRINEPLGPFDSPLILGAKSREMLGALLDAGADINAKSQWWAGGFGLLQTADAELAEFAIERGAIVDIHAAARLGKPDVLEQLLDADPELIHARGGDGQTPLHFAASVEVARHLLDRGAEIDAHDVDHESTPAQYMVRDRSEVARFLVSEGCRTDILMAAALGDIHLARAHLDADAGRIRMSVCDRDFPKQNPRSGGTIYQWTLGRNRLPHVVARAFGHDAVFRLLWERSPPELRLIVAAELGDEASFRDVLAAHPDAVRLLPPDDRSRLVHAATDNNTRAVELMLEAGWPVEAHGQHGATALHWAAFHGNTAMVELLLARNPPIEALDDDFKATPLGWAIYGSKNGWHREKGDYPGTRNALVRAGASPD